MAWHVNKSTRGIKKRDGLLQEERLIGRQGQPVHRKQASRAQEDGKRVMHAQQSFRRSKHASNTASQEANKVVSDRGHGSKSHGGAVSAVHPSWTAAKVKQQQAVQGVRELMIRPVAEKLVFD
jgi:hypothetical protein